MASEVPKVRIVRCPRCRQLLTEYADFPVYKCGGCGAVLQAKNRHANKGNGASHLLDNNSSEKNLLQHVSEDGGSPSDASTLPNNEPAPFSMDLSSAEMDHVGENKNITAPSEKPSYSDSENDCCKVKESSECTEHANMDAGLTGDSPRSREQPGMMEKDTTFVASDEQGRSIHVNMDSCSDSENGCDKVEVECTENANVEAGLTGDSPSSREHPGMIEKDTIFMASDQQGRSIPVNIDSSSDEQLDDSWKLSEQGSVNSSSSSGLVSEEDIVGHPGISCEKMNAPTTMSAHAYDGNDSACDDISNTQRQDLALSSAVENWEISESNTTKEKSEREDNLLENIDADSKPHLQSGILSSNSSDERGTSLAICGSSDSSLRSLSKRAYHRENSRHSDIFYSARKELEDDSQYSCVSRDSSFRKLTQSDQSDSPTRFNNSLGSDRMELLRKVDELRAHLTRPCAQEREGNGRFHTRGAKQNIHRPSFCNHGSGQVPQCCNSNIIHSHSRFFGQRTAQPYQTLGVPFPLQDNGSCLHHHPNDCCIPLQLPHSICCRAHTCHVFCHPSTATSSGCCKDCNIALCTHNSQTSEQHFEKVHYKEKRQSLKRHCIPVLGGAPFVICNNCLRLLQLPADFLVSRMRYHKLRCGHCSDILIFLSHGDHIVPHSGTQLDPAPSEIENPTEHVRTRELPADHLCGHVQGDPVSYSEEYGPPFSNGYSTDGEALPHILRNSLQQDRRRGKRAIGSALHRLMGYDSATELIYQPSDVDEAYESTEIANFYMTSNEIHCSEAHSGDGMGSALQDQSEIRCSPDHTETHKDDRSVTRPTNLKGGSALRGIFKNGIKEPNHGLENMNLKRHTDGRVIPAP